VSDLLSAYRLTKRNVDLPSFVSARYSQRDDCAYCESYMPNSMVLMYRHTFTVMHVSIQNGFMYPHLQYILYLNRDIADVKTAVSNYASPACRTGRQGFSLPKVTWNCSTTLCTGAAAAFDAPHSQQASPASHFVLLTTPPQHPLQTPYSTTPLLYFLLLPANCCNPKIAIDHPSI
jgi:hypothetical protein